MIFAFLAIATLNIPVTITTTPTSTTVAVGSVTTTVPVPTTTPPVCGAQPAPLTQTAQCPAGFTGSWQQTATFTSAPAPACWVQGAFLPSTAPAGACVPVTTPPPVTANCGMQLGSAVTFCDTFDAPKGNGNRAGDLDGNVWGVSRGAGGGGLNFGQAFYNRWNQTALTKCDGSSVRVNAPNDVIICNGQLREASNDNNSLTFDSGDVITLAMYPKQPFDFAGRTGTVAFDVSNDSSGIHGSWPEFWMSDLPVPMPFNHFDSWQTLPANGFGVRMAASVGAGQWGLCPNGNNLASKRWTVDSAVVVRGYVMSDSNGYNQGTLNVKILDCVIEASGPGQFNHVELRISQSIIDVYASDAGSSVLRRIATITNAGLTLTRGLIWLEDVHYNADKSPTIWPTQREHTFSWDNVAFDGPFTYRDFAFDAPDNTTPGANGSVNLGKYSNANAQSSWSVPGLPANPQAAAARVLFSFNSENRPNPTVINVTVNGHVHSVPWPYPDQLIYSWRTFAVTIPLTDLIAGTNVVQLGSNVAEVFANVDIVLVNVAGGVPVLPGSNNAYP